MNKRNAGLNLTAAARFSSLTRRFQCPPCEGLASRRSPLSSAFARSVPVLLPGAENTHWRLLTNLFFQTVQKGPDARRKKNSRPTSSCNTRGFELFAATQQMGLFQQPDCSRASGYQNGPPLAGPSGETSGREVSCSALPAMSTIRVFVDCRRAAMDHSKDQVGHVHDSLKMKLVRKKHGDERRPPGYRMIASFRPGRACTEKHSNYGIKKRTIW